MPSEAGADDSSFENITLADSNMESSTGKGDEPVYIDGICVLGEQQDISNKLGTTIMVNLASIMEKTDEQLLPSVYKYVSCSFNADLGTTLNASLTSIFSRPCLPLFSCVDWLPFEIFCNQQEAFIFDYCFIVPRLFRGHDLRDSTGNLSMRRFPKKLHSLFLILLACFISREIFIAVELKS